MSTSSSSSSGVYTEGRYNSILNNQDSFSSLPPVLALQFLGFAFSEQGENSLRVTNERLNRIREALDDVNLVISLIQSSKQDNGNYWIDFNHPDYQTVKDVLEKYGFEAGSDYTIKESNDHETNLYWGIHFNVDQEAYVSDRLQTETTSLSNELQRLITQAQSEGSRIEQGNSFGESARQTSDTLVDVLLGRA